MLQTLKIVKKKQSLKIFGLIFYGLILLQILRILILKFDVFPTVFNTDPMGLNRLFNFEFLKSDSVLPLFAIVFYTLFLIIFLKYLPKEKMWGIIFLSTGIYSNLVEKIIYKNVLDYFNIGFAIINLADIFIILGLILINFSKQKHKQKYAKLSDTNPSS